MIPLPIYSAIYSAKAIGKFLEALPYDLRLSETYAGKSRRIGLLITPHHAKKSEFSLKLSYQTLTTSYFQRTTNHYTPMGRTRKARIRRILRDRVTALPMIPVSTNCGLENLSVCISTLES